MSEICDDCAPDYLHPTFGPKTIASTFPFAATFVLITFIAYRKVFPLLASTNISRNGLDSPTKDGAAPELTTQSIVRRVAALTFSSTIAFSAVLTELLLCEISNSFNPTARTVALQVTVASLLGLLIVAIPLIGIHTVVSSSRNKSKVHSQIRLRFEWTLQLVGYVVFLFAFWAIGVLLPQSKVKDGQPLKASSVFQGCLDRLAITGVTLMAMLSGFASVSAIWQTFGPKSRPVSDSDIQRKQTGLDATLEMMAEKRTKLQNLEKRTSATSNKNFWSRAMGTFKGDEAMREKQTLEMEISGLETMSSSLESSLNLLRTRKAEQMGATTAIGRLTIAFSFMFACYCIYRIITTSITILRRMVTGTSGKADTDPVTYGIALFARHVYPSLDQASWAHQISFLLSGAMLLASFSAVTQTFHLFSRVLPAAFHATRTNFALLISQISGMYVISSALMLRGMMPEKVGGVINSALGSGLLDPDWVQKCFDGFFMSAVVGTAIGIYLSRKLGSDGVWVDDVGWDGDLEMGKRLE